MSEVEAVSANNAVGEENSQVSKVKRCLIKISTFNNPAMCT
jgi:hypothetical protein